VSIDNTGGEARGSDEPTLINVPKEFIVTRTETVKVYARSEDEAKSVGEEYISFIGGDTVDIQAERV